MATKRKQPKSNPRGRSRKDLEAKVAAQLEAVFAKVIKETPARWAKLLKKAKQFEQLDPQIREVARDRFLGGQPWDAVFAASKALITYIKERSGLDFDGANLVRTAFSPKNPVLAFNALADQIDLDEQEGMMHLFEGAVLAIRNPGGHSFPEGSEQRAMEYISLLSLLAYRVQEATLRKTP